MHKLKNVHKLKSTNFVHNLSQGFNEEICFVSTGPSALGHLRWDQRRFQVVPREPKPGGSKGLQRRFRGFHEPFKNVSLGFQWDWGDLEDFEGILVIWRGYQGLQRLQR